MSIKEFFYKITTPLKHLFVTLLFNQEEKDFLRHNRRTWPKHEIDNEGEILVEVFPVASSIIAHSYFINLLAKRLRTKVIGFHPYAPKPLTHLYNYRFHRAYRSFQVNDFFYVQFTKKQRKAAEQKAEEIIPRLKTKKDVEDLIVDGIWIGDLLYDSHLMRHQVPTLDLDDPKFHESVKESLCYLYYWKEYLETHSVKAMVISHCCYYENGLAVRICIQKKIPCYQINATHGHLMDERHDRAYVEFLYFPEVFKTLTSQEQAAGVAQAKERLNMRFKGVVGVDMHYSTKSAFGKISKERVLKQTPKKKILVAPHCFFDSPHPYGNNLFTDFYEWFSFLGEISNKTDYEWYVKTHPDVLPGNIPVIQQLIKKYPKFTLLPPDTSHNQLIEEGISTVLTVYGTIGVEYAARGILVINASLSNPHVAYKFNINAQSIDEYKKMLLDLGNINLTIKVDDVYEYYYMRYIHTAICWLYNDYDKFLKDIGGHMQQVNPVAYTYFLSELTPEKHAHLMKILTRFLDSGDYYLDKKHLSR